MEIIEVVANLVIGTAEVIYGEKKKPSKRTTILGWLFVIIFVIALFLFTLIMSR